MENVILTGIKPTGEPHLGNYLGAIQPALNIAAENTGAKKYFFIADYHAMTTLKDPKLMREYRQVIAATWLSFFKNQSDCTFYFQSEIPEIFELYWILSCCCPKGLLNRAHAYKALVTQNLDHNNDPDKQINQGVFSYPVLMAADILLFHANQVPVGADQKQHVEIAGEIVNYLNRYLEHPIPKPEPLIDQSVQTIIGTDGQKMSKNYNNTIPIFAEESQLKKIIGKIQTDSTPMGDPLVADTCNVFQLLSHIASPDRLIEIKKEYESGNIGYGHAKQYLLTEHINFFKSAKETFTKYINNPSELEKIMAQSSQKVRETARGNLRAIKQAFGF